ncbi:MAG: hypothetical protein ACR2HN_13165 [Tepidiformaceae bacterium]
MRLTGPSLAFVAVLLLALSGCSSRDDGATVTPAPGGEDEATAAARSTPGGGGGSGTFAPLPPALQQVLDDVAKVRQLSPPPSLRAEVVKRSELPALLDRLLTAEDRQSFAQTTTFYRLLGHLRNDQDFLSVYRSFGSGSILGLYSPQDDQFWVVQEDNDSGGFDNLSRGQKETLAHELVHALQDYHFKLDEVYERTADNLDINLAWTAVVEGDAVAHEEAYTRAHLASPRGSGLFFAADAALQAPDVPPSIARELFFPYTTGTDWLKGVLRSKGLDAVNRMLVDPPKGTAFVLHPELADQGWQPQEVKLPELGLALGSGWQRESGGSWGEFGISNYLRLQLSAADARGAAAGWAGDHYDVYAQGAQSVALFRLAFRDAAEAGEFARRHEEFLVGIRRDGTTTDGATLHTMADGDVTATAGASGNEVVFAIGSSAGLAQAALEAALRA